jgi:hypothetical protein
MNQAGSHDRVHTVVFTSEEGGIRARIATAWFNLLAHPAKARAVAACAEPGAPVPNVESALKEIGVATPPIERLTRECLSVADLVIHLGAAEPDWLAPDVEHDLWAFSEAVRATSDDLRRERDAVEKLVRHLLATRRWLPIGASVPPDSGAHPRR